MVINLNSFNFSSASSHTHGPVDGSLYATILKSPKSPQTPKPVVRTSSQSLISPPAEFSGSATLPTVHSYATSSAARPDVAPNHYEDIRVIHQEQRNSARTTPTPSVTSYASSSKQLVAQQVVITKPPEAFSNYNGSGSNTNANGYVNQAEARESVRSPLTLSMDSGISSSGVVNRRGVQGSSVSPNSFPSQASPQGRKSVAICLDFTYLIQNFHFTFCSNV